MSHTFIADDALPKIANRAISCYRRLSDHFENIDYTPLNRIYGDGNVNTSIEDLFKWDQALYADRLVSQATPEKAFTPGKLNNGSATNYGFGWTIGDADGRRIVQHNGAWVGFRTYIGRIPGERFTVIVLRNLETFRPQIVGEQIAHVYLDQRLAPPK